MKKKNRMIDVDPITFLYRIEGAWSGGFKSNILAKGNKIVAKLGLSNLAGIKFYSVNLRLPLVKPNGDKKDYDRDVPLIVVDEFTGENLDQAYKKFCQTMGEGGLLRQQIDDALETKYSDTITGIMLDLAKPDVSNVPTVTMLNMAQYNDALTLNMLIRSAK